MLLGNYTQLNANPGRNIGGFSNPWDWMKVSNIMKFYLGEAIVSSTTDRSSFNNGYVPPYSWSVAPKAGGIAINNGIVGAGTIDSSNLAGGVLGVADIQGISSISVDIIGIAAIITNIAGTSDISADIAGQLNMAADLVGVGDLTGALGALVNILADLIGISSLEATGLAATFIAADLSGQGNLIGDIAGLVEIIAALTGTSSTSIDIIGSWSMLSDLIGSGAFISDVNAIGIISSALTGIGTFTITIGTTTGTISADISACGDVVTSESIARAVWDSLLTDFMITGSMGETMNLVAAGTDPWSVTLEGTYTAGEMLKLLTAVAAGKSDIVKLGNGLATITFRDINDTENRVIASMTNSERTAVILNP